MPLFLKAAAAAGAVMNLTSALAASASFCSGNDAARERGELLDVRRQRTDVIDPRKVRQFAHLLEADLGLPAGDDAAHEHARRRLLELVLDRVSDAHALEQADHIDPARTGGVADRLRR